MRPARNITQGVSASYVPAALPVFHVYEEEGMVKALVRRRTIDNFAEGAPMARVVGKLFPDGGENLLSGWKS